MMIDVFLHHFHILLAFISLKSYISRMVKENIIQNDIITPHDRRVFQSVFAEAYQIATQASSDPRMLTSQMLNSRIGQNIYMNVNDFLRACSDNREIEGEVIWQPSISGGCGHVEYLWNGNRVTVSRVKSVLDPPRKSNYRREAALTNQDEMVGLGMNFKSVFADEEIPNKHKFKDFCITHGTDTLNMIRLVLPGLDEQDRVISLWRGENWIDQSIGLPPIAFEEPVKPIDPIFKGHLVEVAKKEFNG
jgi:hypothetical protein